jgi:hypothetical protein
MPSELPFEDIATRPSHPTTRSFPHRLLQDRWWPETFARSADCRSYLANRPSARLLDSMPTICHPSNPPTSSDDPTGAWRALSRGRCIGSPWVAPQTRLRYCLVFSGLLLVSAMKLFPIVVAHLRYATWCHAVSLIGIPVRHQKDPPW